MIKVAYTKQKQEKYKKKYKRYMKEYLMTIYSSIISYIISKYNNTKTMWLPHKNYMSIVSKHIILLLLEHVDE
jgi:5-formaminoimidazole-4-carboxamide-1-beta-D-ribofuranosyl 5'-monophosphate synthetase